jgi:hypothetical protein
VAFQVGQILQHKALPELGRARVDAIIGDNIHLQFEVATGGELKVFRTPNEGLVAAADQSQSGFGTTRSGAAVKKKAAAKKAAKVAAPKQVWGFDEAWGRFNRKYPAGFQDPQYLAEERGYKAAVVERWKEQFGTKGLAALKSAGDPAGVEKAFLAVYQGLNLMYPVEWVKLRAALKGSMEGLGLAEDYAAAVAEGSLSEARFKGLLKRFDVMGLGAGKWTQLTLWPYLAGYKNFPYIKPEVTKAVAEGMGLTINYDAKPNFATYTKVLELYQALWLQLEPKGAKDWVDVQTFIWLGWG